MKHALAILVLLTAVALVADVVKMTPDNVQSTMVREGVAIMIITSDDCPASNDMARIFDELSKSYPDIVFAEFDLDTPGFEQAKEQVGGLTEPMYSPVIGGEFGAEFSGVFAYEEMQERIEEWRAQWQAQLDARKGFRTNMNFTLKDLDGNTVTLNEFDGLIILDFWATWCPPCRAEIPVLQQLHEEYGESGLIVVGVSAEDNETVSEWVAEQREAGVAMDYYLLVDPDRTVNDQYGIQSIPTTYFIAPNGDLLKKHSGFAPEMEAEFRKMIEANLLEKE